MGTLNILVNRVSIRITSLVTFESSMCVAKCRRYYANSKEKLHPYLLRLSEILNVTGKQNRKRVQTKINFRDSFFLDASFLGSSLRPCGPTWDSLWIPSLLLWPVGFQPFKHHYLSLKTNKLLPRAFKALPAIFKRYYGLLPTAYIWKNVYFFIL